MDDKDVDKESYIKFGLDQDHDMLRTTDTSKGNEIRLHKGKDKKKSGKSGKVRRVVD